MFHKFKISDVFYKIDTPKIKAKANDFPTEYSEEYCVPLLTAGAENQGFNRYAKTSDCPMIINNAISVSANGANSGICFYQPHNFAVLQDAYAVKVNGREIDGVEEGLYLTGALNKAVRDNHNWVNKAGWNHIKDDSIELPVIENPDLDHEYTPADIDWAYMEEHIRRIEKEYIRRLEEYLKVTGLDDYTLTDEDKKILSNAAQHEFKEFAVKDILPPINIKKYAKKPESKGNIPFVSCQTTNNGIASYCGEVPEVSHCITVSTNGNCFDCFWHNYPIIPSSDVEVLHKDGITDNAEISLCLCSALSLNTRLYSYSNKPKNGKVFDTIISLPVIESSDPDHEYTVDDIDWQDMERYIRAMEKVVIADVVKYKDRVIDETRKLVS